MSTETNKAGMRRMFEEGWNQGDLGVVDELLAADAHDHHDPDVPSFPEHLKETIVLFRRAFPDLRYTIEDMIAEGDKVACRVTLTGTHRGVFNGIPPTGRAIRVEQIHIARIVAGKGREHWAALEMLTLLQQLGAIPARGGEARAAVGARG